MIMFAILFIIIPLLTQHQVCSSPVLLWSNLNLPQSAVPLSTLSPLDVISNYICKLDSDQIEIHLFAVDELNNEDIQRGSQSNNPILLDAKNEKSQYRYIPHVGDDVYNTFSLIPQSNNMRCSHINFLIASSNTFSTLENALNAMQTSLDNIGNNPKTVQVIALISSPIIYQTLTRQTRDIEVNEDDVLISEDRSCMFYADKLYWENSQQSSDNYSLNLERSSCQPIAENNNNASAVILELYWENELDEVNMTLVANLTGLYWYLQSAAINYTEYRYFAYGIYNTMDTPPKYSYVCTNARFVKYSSDKPTKHGSYDFKDQFYITNLQFQPFGANGSYFGPPNYCTSFFTSGIWMGITSSLLCLGILLVGVTRIMSIKSNDRFDDPKGKPLIIKAQE